MTSTGRFDYYIDPDHLVREGVCTADNADYIALLYSCYLALLADSPLNSVELKPRRVFGKFLRKLLCTPFKVLASTYSDLSHELLSNLYSYGVGSTTGPFLEDFRDTPIFKEYHEFFLTGRPDLLRFITTFLLFPKKAVLSDPTLEPDAFRKWLDVEMRITSVQLDAQVMTELKHLINLSMPALDRVVLQTRFSNGSTMDGMRSLSSKLSHFDYNVYIDRTFFAAQHGCERPGAVLESLPDPSAWLKARNEAHSCRRESELMFVPKTFKAYRSICKERPTLAYFQQALFQEHVENIKAGPLRLMIDLSDQTLNQQMALRGSISGFLDTIDLSSASDSVSLQLVRSVFPARLLRFLLATRSNTVVYKHDGKTERFRVAKFAPMGSAVCFTTQCILFSAIVLRECLIQKHGRYPFDLLRSPKDLEAFIHDLAMDDGAYPKLQRPRVYGDDIVCDTRVTQRVVDTLTSCGFEVNVAKSFVSSQSVRESCGIYAYGGKDITPLLWKIPYFSGRIPMKCVVALVDLCNRAGDRLYRNLHSCLVNILLESPIEGATWRSPVNPILFTDKREKFGIYSVEPRNWHLLTRSPGIDKSAEDTCEWFQRDEYSCVSPRARKTGRDERDIRVRAEYHKWVVASVKRGDSCGTQSATTYHESVEVVAPQLVWTPAY